MVDAAYLEPAIPALTPPPFDVGEAVRVVPAGRLPDVADASSSHVVVGSGKTATDAIVWLLGRGIDPGAICWVRPRDPWMLDRAVIQPDPAVFLGVAATLLEAGAAAASLEDLFLRLEDAGVALRIDPGVFPTMAPPSGRARSSSTGAACRSRPTPSSSTVPPVDCRPARRSRSGGRAG